MLCAHSSRFARYAPLYRYNKSLVPFIPIFRNPHLLTIAGNFWPREFEHSRYPIEDRLYRTAPDVQVRVQSQLPVGQAKGHVVLIHGLEGSGESGYIKSLSFALLENGYAAHRFHMRTCGGTQHLCQTLYHAGLTSDLHSVLEQFEAEHKTPVVLAGFSLGGNVALKLAGELGDSASRYISAVVATSTPIDLGASALRIGRGDNSIYERRFVKRMVERMMSTGRYSIDDLRGIRSIYEIDDLVTAPHFGFGTADNYYFTQSAVRFLDSIRVPTLVIQAKDDTFIPFEIFKHQAFRTNSSLQLLATQYGGHLGFLSKDRPRFWVDVQILEWLNEIGYAAEFARSRDALKSGDLSPAL